jgi:hypothetical protein
LNSATNLQWFDVFLSTKRQVALDHEGGELVRENFMVGQILKELVEEKGKACTMNGIRRSKLFSEIGSHGVLWIPSTTNVLP